jgi:protocatechuate 3,4-dioxygenase beta subunit
MHDHDFDRRLSVYLTKMSELATRRSALQWLGGAALLPVVGCAASSSSSGGTDTRAGGDGDTGADASSDPDVSSPVDTSSTGADTTTTPSAPESCDPIPSETGGPYPGDGTNGPNVLNVEGVVRSDIRSSFGDLTGTADGVPLTIELTLAKNDGSCSPLAGYAVYLWHCTRDGKYSLYTDESQNYLRGVQESDSNGRVVFSTIFPGCYSGRWPHVHFEIFDSLTGAVAGTGKVRTSQLAFPEAVCETVYDVSGYEDSVSSLSGVSLESDNVFGDDDGELQMATVTGDNTTGYVATLVVGLAA